MPGHVVTEPVYHQLARLCREGIARGLHTTGSRFPSERDLASTHGVSRATANKVIATLVAEGLLSHRPGIGTFVTGHTGLHTSLREMESFTAHASASGFTPSTSVLHHATFPQADLPAHVAAGLGLGDDSAESILFVERLRLADDAPVILEHRWLRLSRLPGLQAHDLAGSFYQLLDERFGLRPTGELHEITARALPAHEASLLGTTTGAPALVVEGPGFIRRREPLWFQTLFYRADRYALRNEVSSGRAHATTTVSLRLPHAPSLT